ncbi:MAG: ABC-F family ATP-binding cassette domain-containing protein [Sphaerochaetaceae bacterium]|nr:ABC-F family ATP-binding cassette domain-containing protein [Sphaerochaetaceae bacterium]
MNALSVYNISKSVKDDYLFSEVSFGLEAGEHLGIIGKNGAGKSTFLKLIAGQTEPDDGQITINNSLRVAFLEQEVRFPEDCTLEGFLRLSKDPHVQLLVRYESGDHQLMDKLDTLGIWDIGDRYRRYLTELGVSRPLDEKMAYLSGGMQKKAAIARILAIEPNILLLDEPTNHLDIPAIEWLESHLGSEQFTVLLVTHDRYFLDRICNRIMEIDRRKVHFYEGGYTSFLEGREQRINALQKEQERLATILRRELEWLHRGPKARTGKDSGRKQRIEDMLGQQTKAEEESRAFSSIARRMGKKILELKDVSASRGGRQILKGFNLEFVKGQRFGVIGENGSGKSTLLEVMTGNLSPDSGTVDTGVNTVFGYYDQNSVNLPLDKTPIEFLSDISELIVLSSDYAVTPARFLELFGFPTSFHRLPISVLSGGEKRRLYLLSTLVRNPNFLVLDEPTNDLDIDTLRRLEQYILDFNGCVISVSHDRAFLDRTCTELIIMPEARRFEGNYTDYHESVQAQGKVSAPAAESQNKDQSRRRDHQKKGLSFKEKREFEDLTAEIEALETEKQELEDFFTSGQVDQGGQRQRRYNEIGQRLEACYPRWETLAELAE